MSRSFGEQKRDSGSDVGSANCVSIIMFSRSERSWDLRCFIFSRLFSRYVLFICLCFSLLFSIHFLLLFRWDIVPLCVMLFTSYYSTVFLPLHHGHIQKLILCPNHFSFVFMCAPQSLHMTVLSFVVLMLVSPVLIVPSGFEPESSDNHITSIYVWGWCLKGG